MKKVEAESLGAVHTHTHTIHLENEKKDKENKKAAIKSKTNIEKLDKSKKVHEENEDRTMFTKNKESAITLIALVITIIVLLILAGVSIATLTGTNGILTQAQKAKQSTEESEEKEKKQLLQIEASTHFESYDYTDEEGNMAKIPAEFAVSNVEGENLISKGLVIIGKTGNEYVWIPCTEDTYKREETKWFIQDSDNVKACRDELSLEDATVSTSEAMNGITNDVLVEIIQQIKDEKESIRKVRGYYIGRYETANENGSAVIKPNLEPWTTQKWSEMYEEAKKIDVGVTAESYLCSSYAWDTAINFIEKHSTADNYGASMENINGNWKETSVKNKIGNIIKRGGEVKRLKTGVTTSYANIYDMGGNVLEFTTELNPNKSKDIICRGGGYNYSLAAGARNNWISGGKYENYGFRATLFLK